MESKDRKVILNHKRLINSFKYAFKGIYGAYKDEQNLRIHTFIAVLVVIFGFILHISYTEWLVCLVLIGLVIMSEFFNTSIENVVDLASPEVHPLAKLAKDTAAAGVLMMAIIASIIGIIIFAPKIVTLVGGLL